MIDKINSVVIQNNNKVLKKEFNSLGNYYNNIEDSQETCSDGIVFKKKDVNFEEEFKEVRERIVKYVKNDMKNNPVLSRNLQIYVVVNDNTHEILSSYPSTLFNRLNEDNLINKNFLEYKKLYNFEYYIRYFLDFMFLPIFNDLPRRMKFDFIDSYLKYENSILNKENFPRRFFFEPDQNLQQNSITLGFLGKSDANCYRRHILLKTMPFKASVIKKRLKRVYLYLRKKKKSRSSRRSKGYKYFQKRFPIKVKAMKLVDLQNSLKESKYFEDVEKNRISNIFVLIPNFFSYEKKKLFFMFDTKKVIKNFPNEMLSRNGSSHTIYQTKPIKKRQVLRNYKYFKDLKIPLKYLDDETFFITINKTEYEKLAKKDKKKVFFYDKKVKIKTTFGNLEFNYDQAQTDFSTTIYRRKQHSLEELATLLLKIKNKIRNLKKLVLIKNFINNNFDEPHLLEKTSYYIDKINRKRFSINIFKIFNIIKNK